MATYPGGVKTFTTKVDGAGNKVFASHINDLQDEVTAIEDGLLNGTAPVTSSRVTAAALQVAGGSTFTGAVRVAGTSTFEGVATFSTIVHAPSQPSFNVFSTVAYSGIAASTTSVTFEQEVLDQGGFHSTGTSPDRVTIPSGSSGLYWLHGSVFFLNFGAAGALAITKNGTRIVGTQIFASSIAGHTCQIAMLDRFDAADILRLEIIGATGSTWSAGSGTLGFESRFQGTKVS